MAIVTTYVCDVSGVSGTKKSDFVEVDISAQGFYEVNPVNNPGVYSGETRKNVKKLVSRSVAEKLGLTYPKQKDEVVPEPTFESKLAILLKERMEEIAYEVAEDVVQSSKNY